MDPPTSLNTGTSRLPIPPVGAPDWNFVQVIRKQPGSHIVQVAPGPPS